MLLTINQTKNQNI